VSDGDASLLRLVDRLAAMLERSDLAELEVEAGGTGLLLRKPIALERAAVASTAGEVTTSETRQAGATGGGATSGTSASAERAAPTVPSVKAPLTGIFYTAPSPGATPYVAVGDHVSVGQVIGLIEAMKLFNEIKSDLAGRVVRFVAETGGLVKAKQPLVEVEPL
jgi:acetyl-CoA carboxylase biotin carboxyl carrier protein